jgi:hypothetical protein
MKPFAPVTRVFMAALLTMALGACTHAPAAPPPDDGHGADAIRARMEGDPFAEVDAGPPEPVAAPAPPPPAVDPRDAADAALAQALLDAKGKPGCADLLGPAVAGPARPAALQKGLSALAACQQKAKQLPEARKTALRWLLACNADGCRRSALGQLKSLAGQAPKDGRLTARLAALAQAEACVDKVQGSGKPSLEGCAGGALQTFQSWDDAWLVQKLRLAEAKWARRLKKPDVLARFEKAAASCAEPRCRSLSDQVFDAWVSELSANKAVPKEKQPEEILKVRLAQNERAVADAAAPQKPYTRLPALDKACAAVEALKPGACRALEHDVTGRYTFHDASLQLVPGDLPTDRVTAVNEEFAVTLQDCFRAQATRIPVPSMAVYALRWMVGNDGHVTQLEIDPDPAPLDACLRERFATWRYPRSSGENPHCEQHFTISARPK